MSQKTDRETRLKEIIKSDCEQVQRLKIEAEEALEPFANVALSSNNRKHKNTMYKTGLGGVLTDTNLKVFKIAQEALRKIRGSNENNI